MSNPEPEYLSKFRQTLKAALTELPSETDLIAALSNALVEARGTIRAYQIRNRRLESEAISLRLLLQKITDAASHGMEESVGRGD